MGNTAPIENAINAGKVVTVSKSNITYSGWTGCGYIIINPETGAGAYMISGGLSGAVIASATFGSITEYLLKQKDYGNYDYRTRLAKYGKAFGVLNKVALFVSIVETMLNEKLSESEKMGQICLSTLSSITADRGVAAIGKTLNPLALLGAGLAIGIILSVSFAISLIFIAREIQLAMIIQE